MSCRQGAAQRWLGRASRLFPAHFVGERAYGEHPRQRLDCYEPVVRQYSKRPLLVFFYGGSWRTGSKADYEFVGRSLAARGLDVAVVDYRLYPEVGFPAFVEDGARAVSVLASDHTKRQIVLIGHSAGAHIAAMLALDRQYLRAWQVADDTIVGLIGLAGAYDFTPIRDPVLQNVFGSVEDWPASQPINFVEKSSPPMVLLHGLADDTVTPGNSRRLAAAARTKGVPADLRLLPGINHSGLIGRVALPRLWPGVDIAGAVVDAASRF